MAEDSKNNAAWLNIFDELDIRSHLLSEGLFKITAKTIHKFGGREPRLMTKFDHRKSRPKIMQTLGITVLPITNGEYVLLSGDGYCSIPPPNTVERYDPKSIGNFQTLRWQEGLRSEPQVIDTLFCASALRSFLGDQTLTLTLRGKLRSKPFNFTFKTENHGVQRVAVNGVQIEIDSGYEGQEVAVVEAKFGETSDLIIRQLFYPYRHLLESGISKKIRLIYLIYSNKVFSLYEVAFGDPNQYHSCKITRQKHYTLEKLNKLPTFAEIVTNARPRPHGRAPFPQADDASKIIDVIELLFANPLSKSEIAEHFEVDPRQGDYYGNAAAWLGFAEKSRGQFYLTLQGTRLAHMSRADRITTLAESVAAMPVFREVTRFEAKGGAMTAAEISELIARKAGLTGSTPTRRASTVRSWIDWLKAQLSKPEA